MKEVGKVVKTLGTLATVEIKQGAACAKCGICSFDKSGSLMMEAINDAGSSAGDLVEVEVAGRDVIMSGLLIFIIPLVIFFAGYIMMGIYLASASLAVYLACLYFYDKSKKAIPRITRVLSNG